MIFLLETICIPWNKNYNCNFSVFLEIRYFLIGTVNKIFEIIIQTFGPLFIFDQTIFILTVTF